MASPAVRRILFGGRPYVGPGDIVSGATTWASSARAYSAAFAASQAPIMDLVDTATGLITTTVNIRRNGFVNLYMIPPYACSISKLYDQTGAGNHWTQSTLSQMPTLTRSALNGLPGITCASASAQRLDTAQTLTPPSASGPMTFSGVAKRTLNFTTKQSIIGCQTAQGMGISFATSADTASVHYIGTTVSLGSVPDNVFHAIQGIVSGASSVVGVDGRSNTGTLTGSDPGANQGFRLGRDQGGNNPFDGIIMEVGVWMTTAFSTGDITSMNSNQHGASGYSF